MEILLVLIVFVFVPFLVVFYHFLPRGSISIKQLPKIILSYFIQNFRFIVFIATFFLHPPDMIITLLTCLLEFFPEVCWQFIFCLSLLVYYYRSWDVTGDNLNRLIEWSSTKTFQTRVVSSSAPYETRWVETDCRVLGGYCTKKLNC